MKPEELARTLNDLLEWAQEHSPPPPEAELPRRLREHLGAEPKTLEVLSEELSSYDHVNLQVALDADREHGNAELEVIGLSTEHGFHAGLAEIAQRAEMYGEMLSPGPVEWVGVDVGDRTVKCIKSGLVLIAEGDERLVALMAPGDDGGFGLEVMAARRGYAETWLARIRDLMSEHNVYRGKIVTFGGDHPFRPRALTVRQLPHITRDRIVLPQGTLDRIERHTAGLAEHRDTLREAGRHIKRGVLLHGPPGTGKTLTIMYLAGLMAERTVVLLTGGALQAIEPACHLARSLEPAMVVMEDVDLVALGRSHYSSNPILFDLLNAMDGLEEDADLIFALTTNRAEMLEPALASRPGRIDLAVELPLPDAEARLRLFELYGEGLEVTVADWDPIVAGSEGTSPAFIRELMRRAALLGAERTGTAHVTDTDLLTAIEELKHQSGRLTASLLGAERPPDAPPTPMPEAHPAPCPGAEGNFLIVQPEDADDDEW